VTDEEDRLLQLATSICLGRQVDWDEVERSASDKEEREIIHGLRLLASISEVHAVEHAPGEAQDAGPAAGVPIPSRWGRLQIRERLGSGAFGDVYRAWDGNLEREVALKILHHVRRAPGAAPSAAPAAGVPAETDPGGRAGVLQEARALARVRHPNVITVHGADVEEGRVGIWMELIAGRTLEDLVREQGPLGAREAALVGLDLCRALTALHRVGLVHRDVKARNVMREHGGRIVLMDFGAARELGELQSARAFTGTPFYMAPEVLCGEPSSPQSDLYSLGVLLYHLVTASYPVEANSLQELCAAHARRESKLLRQARSDLPEAFVRVVETALAFTTGERFASAAHMEQALSSALGVDARPEPAAAPRSGARGAPRRDRRRVLLVLIALVGVAGAGWLLTRLLHRTARPTVASPSEINGELPSTAGASQTPGSVPAQSSEGTSTRTQPPAGAEPAPPKDASAPVPGTAQYTVEAAFYRVAGGAKERLVPGARLRPGDGVVLELRGSLDLHVYVVNEDDRGQVYLLFPHPRLVPRNPLRASVRHVLPGMLDGEKITWEVTTAGGREHFLIVASPKRLVEFESEVLGLDRPQEGRLQYPQVSDTAKVRLRGVGGFRKQPVPGEIVAPSRLFDLASRLGVRPEAVQGVWVRQIDFENPAP
jgi:serine/threonine-protein kinase